MGTKSDSAGSMCANSNWLLVCKAILQNMAILMHNRQFYTTADFTHKESFQLHRYREKHPINIYMSNKTNVVPLYYMATCLEIGPCFNYLINWTLLSYLHLDSDMANMIKADLCASLVYYRPYRQCYISICIQV